jgi:hypothetical protein
MPALVWRLWNLDPTPSWFIIVFDHVPIYFQSLLMASLELPIDVAKAPALICRPTQKMACRSPRSMGCQ